MKRYTQADIIKNTKMLPMILKQEQARNSMAIQSLVHNKLRIENEKIAHNAALAQSLSPYKVLARGYGLVLNENGTINSVKKTKKGSAVEVVLADGRLFCKVEDIMEEKHANL